MSRLLLSILSFGLVLVTGAFHAIQAAPVGSSFVYQGALAQSGTAATGLYDMEFRLYAGETSDFELAPVELITAVEVSAGNFAVTLDFGQLPFDGEEAWLEISVRPAGGSDPLTVLSPRQPIRTIPYALHASSVPADAIGSGNVVDGAISTLKLANGAVVAGKLADRAVTTAKLDDSGATPDGVLGFRDGQVQWLTRSQLADSSRGNRLKALLGDDMPALPPGIDASACLASGDLAAQLSLDGEVFSSVHAMSASEAISGRNRYWMVFDSTRALNAGSVLGQTASLTLTNSLGSAHFSGPVIRLELMGAQGSSLTYRLALGPPWATLDLASDFSVHQAQAIPDVIESETGAAGLAIQSLLNFNYDSSDLEIRYAETAWQFVRRLMEREGLFLTTRHEVDSAQAVLGDTNASFVNTSISVPLLAAGSALGSTPGVTRFSRTSALGPVHVSTQGFGDNTPPTGLFVSSDTGGGVRGDYAFESGLKTMGAVSFRQGVRVRQHAAELALGTAISNVPQIRAGYQFDVVDTSTAALGGRYLATAVRHALLAETTGGCLVYSNQIEILPDSVPFALPAVTPMPALPAVTSATVVGAAGDVVHSDGQGRIRVQFHWDGKGQFDETSGPFVRVATPTENLLGGQALPRVGSEVLVSFVDGDPGQPVVVGSLHNPAFPVTVDQGGLSTLVAGVSFLCSGPTSKITRVFRNPAGSDPAIGTASISPGCTLDLGFDLSERFWSVSADAPAFAATAACAMETSTSLSCSAVNFGGSRVPANLMLLVH